MRKIRRNLHARARSMSHSMEKGEKKERENSNPSPIPSLHPPSVTISLLHSFLNETQQPGSFWAGLLFPACWRKRLKFLRNVLFHFWLGGSGFAEPSNAMLFVAVQFGRKRWSQRQYIDHWEDCNLELHDYKTNMFWKMFKKEHCCYKWKK